MDGITDDSAKLTAAPTAAEARREARIKRILGNSKNRLNKIAGKEENANGNSENCVSISYSYLSFLLYF